MHRLKIGRQKDKRLNFSTNHLFLGKKTEGRLNVVLLEWLRQKQVRGETPEICKYVYEIQKWKEMYVSCVCKTLVQHFLTWVLRST